MKLNDVFYEMYLSYLKKSNEAEAEFAKTKDEIYKKRVEYYDDKIDELNELGQKYGVYIIKEFIDRKIKKEVK
jgi:uncharacterized protein (UPF0210 family)